MFLGHSFIFYNLLNLIGNNKSATYKFGGNYANQWFLKRQLGNQSKKAMVGNFYC